MKAWRNLSIRFGLVNVPVSLAPLVRSGGSVEAHRYTPDGQRARQAWIDGAGNIVPTADLVTSYDTPGGPVTLPAPVEVPGDKGIDLAALVPLASVDPLYFDSAYVVWPGKGGERSFAALVEALTDAEGMALAGTVRVTDRPRPCLLRYSPEADAVILHVLAYAAAVRFREITGLPPTPAADPSDLAQAEAFLDGLPTTFAPVEADPLDAAIAAALLAAVPTPAPAAPAAEPRDLLADLHAGGIS